VPCRRFAVTPQPPPGAPSRRSDGDATGSGVARETRVVLLRAHGALSLALADPSGKTRAELAVRPDGSAYLAFAQRDETSRLGLGVSADGVATLGFYDRQGRTRVELGVVDDAGPGLALLDESGQVVWSAP
jgi:hypothetical protein